MNETEPLYFTEFKKEMATSISDLGVIIKDHVIDKMATKDDIRDMATKQDLYELEEKIKIATKEDLDELEERIRKEMVTKDDLDELKETMVTKEDIKPILQHIGAYEIRAKNVEDILLKDHRPRIVDLEKVVFR